MNRDIFAQRLEELVGDAISLFEIADDKRTWSDNGVLVEISTALSDAIAELREVRRLSRELDRDYEQDFSRKPRAVETVSIEEFMGDLETEEEAE